MRPGDAPPALVMPRAFGAPVRLHGPAAAEVLAALLPTLNGADCAAVPIGGVVERVARAEVAAARELRARERRPPRGGGRQPGQARPPRARRPWEHLASGRDWTWLASAPAADRLALEMAVTEEVERVALASRAAALAAEWRDEEEVGAIADDLLVPEPVRARLEAVRAARPPEVAGDAGAGATSHAARRRRR